MRLALVIAALATLPACGLDEVVVTLQGNLTVPGTEEEGPVVVPDVPIEGLTGVRFAAQEALARRGVRTSDIAHVRLESLTLSPSGGADLDPVEYVEIFLDSPGEPEVPIAEKHVAEGERKLDLEAFDAELAAYARASSMSLRAAIQRRRPGGELPLEVKVRFRVEVTSAAF